MPYTPLNKIQTNLHTDGGEFVYKGTYNSYTGYYHRYYNGKIFTGKSPDDQNIEELEVYKPTPLEETSSQVSSISNTADADTVAGGEDIKTQLVLNYEILKKKEAAPQKLPGSYIPTPTDQDYNIGEITRYFVKKTNEYRYTEVSKDTYTAILNRDPQYIWQYYTPFSLPWQISGDEMEVAKVNRNMVLLTEQRNKIRGLQEFLRFDYLKFYKS